MWSFFSRDPAKGFPYEIGEKVHGLDSDQSIWSLHEGKQKSNGYTVSVFVFDATSGNESAKQTAQASVKRLRTLRHPNVLSFIDSLETDKFIYMVTEHVKPLRLYLEDKEVDSTIFQNSVSWGLHQIVKGLSFLLNTVNLIHNNVCISSMFVDKAGEWKLGGIDYMYPASGEGSNIPPIKTLPALEKYDPPEKAGSSGRSKKSVKWSTDMWGLGCLIWEAFNGNLPRSSSLKVIGKIPKALVRNYCELVSANPVTRPNPDKFLESCKMSNGFMDNHFVLTNLFIEEIQIKEGREQSNFFSDLINHLDEFPPDYCKHRILPQILHVYRFGKCTPSVLPPLFKLGKLLDAAEYQARIVPCVVRLFSSIDRATRIHLLRQLPSFAEHLQPIVVNSQLFPNIVTGFMDTNPAIREQSVKGMLLLAPKLNDNNLNNELMKHFARLQSHDDQGPIRTNTTVCLGKITSYLNSTTRQKVISSAFSRAMKDPFPAARIAGILAMSNNVQYFTTTDCAMKALPPLCALTIDSDMQVRENAFKTIKVFLEKLQKASDNPEEAEKMNQAAATAPQNASSASAGWTGWMSTGVTSLTSKLYTSKASSGQPAEVNPAKVSSSHSATKQAAPETSEQVAPSVKKELAEEQEKNGWNDEKYDDTEENSDANVNKEEEESYDGWDNSSWGAAGEKDEPVAEEENNEWGGGWADESWSDEPKPASKVGRNWEKSQQNEDVNPASSYDWSQDAKETEDSFFNAFSPQPIKSNTKSLTSKQPMRKKAVTKPTIKPETEAKKDDTWDADDWGDGGWGEEAGSGLSEAEKLKLEREEKRRLRQKQLQEKRAAKGSGKLGARKCD